MPNPRRLPDVLSGVIDMSAAALELIGAESLRSVDGKETGGILLGHETTDGSVIVTVAGPPGPNATRRPSRFLRDLAFSKALADEAYESDGSVWIGDWHTHPKGPDGPSRYDVRTYHRLLDDAELDFEHFLSIVVTSARPDWSAVRLSFWLFEKGRRNAARLDNAASNGTLQSKGVSDELRS